VTVHVELTIPVQADLIVLARLTSVTMAARAGFNVEEVEDLRLAVDELCISVVDAASDGTLTLTFITGEGHVEVNCIYRGTPLVVDGSLKSAGQDLSSRILDALVDEHGEEMRGGSRRAWLTKRSGLTTWS
jgi:anti-sigma regulatory factor (Ser/Thr protein kinase)